MKKEIELMNYYLNQTQYQVDKILNRSDYLINSLKTIKLNDDSQIYFVGNGSSGEGARIAAYLVLELFGKNPIYVNPYQFANYSYRGVKENDLVIALSQTGTSHLVVESVRLANQAKAFTVGLSATDPSPIIKEAQYPIVLEECVEKVDYKVTGVLGLLYGLWIIVLGVAYANDKITKSKLDETIDNFKSINSKYDELANLAKQWTEVNVDRLEESFTLTVLGSGPLVELAMELAVKSIEVQNRFSISVDTEEFLHGICAANAKCNVVILLVDQESYEYSKKVYDAISARNQSVIWIGHQAPDQDLSFTVDVKGAFNTAYFMPVVHALLIKWAELMGYGDHGTEVFKYYQDILKVREEIK
jgi:fructoselysine-6-P-deglycase FrlB-like protein